MSADLRWMIAAVPLGGGVVLALWWALSSASHTPGPVLMAAPAPKPKPSAVAPPAPPEQPRVWSLPPPQEEPPPPAEEPPVRVLDVEDHKTIQRSAHQAVKSAENECVKPWVEDTRTSAELVVDTIVLDGAVVDVEMRGLVNLPDDVVDCVRDVIWQTDWPVLEAEGELRYQHAMDVEWREPVVLPEERPRRPADAPEGEGPLAPPE